MKTEVEGVARGAGPGSRSSEASGTSGTSAASIVRALREEIVGGALRPGVQLPTRIELKKRFGTTSVTVQRALDRLAQDEFVYSNGRRGTFVAESPPHLSRYALVFPHRPSEPSQWRRFWSALSSEGALIEQSGQGHQLPIYHHVNAHAEGEGFDCLARDVRTHRVAGLIFAANPVELRGTLLLDQPGVPRVAIMGSPLPHVPDVKLDLGSFVDKALDFLAARGRKRVAIVLPTSLPSSHHHLWRQGIARRGMETRPYWVQAIHLAAPEAARGCVHLLLNPEQRVRPDALVVTDDNLAEHALAGLIASGAHAAGEVEVVAHCNFPWAASSILPATRLGFDAREVLLACVRSIDAQRRGEHVPPETRIEAVFEHEFSARRSAPSHPAALMSGA